MKWANGCALMETVFSSSAWKVLGEGKDGKLNTLPGGRIGQWQADHVFYNTDFRFTVGKDGMLYVWCMTVPKAGDKLTIVSLGTNKGLFDKKIRSVELMGTEQSVDWKQNADGLEIVYPDSVDLKTAVGFRIVCE